MVDALAELRQRCAIVNVYRYINVVALAQLRQRYAIVNVYQNINAINFVPWNFNSFSIVVPDYRVFSIWNFNSFSQIVPDYHVFGIPHHYALPL